jgi:DNA-binding response OmpR family regulator
MRILILAEAGTGVERLARALEQAGLDFASRARLSEAEHLLRSDRFEALVFEPGLTGPDFLPRMLRDHPARALVAWQRTSSSARVAELLDAGADEVLDGTMGAGELVSRVRNATRHGRRPIEGTLESGGLSIDLASGEARWNGKALPLTRREREVLRALAEAGGEPVRRELIYRRVWGYAMVRGDRSVDVNVKRLRTKLATSGAELAIRTAPGVGYRLEVPSRPKDLAGVAAATGP